MQQETSKSAIESFIGRYLQAESQRLLWQLLKSAVAGNIGELSSADRQNLLSFYEQLQQVLPEIYAIERIEAVAFSPLAEGGDCG